MWLDFKERLCWRLFFSFTKTPENKELYDPCFEVPYIHKGKVPKLPQYLEHGISNGHVFVYKMIHNIRADEGKDTYKMFSPKSHPIKEYLVNNEYVITNTDKNLGMAVSEWSWLIEKCLELLSDEKNNSLIDPLTAQIKLDKQCIEIEVIALIAETFLPNGKLFGNYLWHLITRPKEKYSVSVFYGILKIHKEPILPCHSVIRNPAAKYVAKILKLIIKSVSSSIHGTKDLAIKSSKSNLQST